MDNKSSLKPRISPGPYLGEGALLFLVRDAPGLIVETHQHLYHEFDMVLSGSGSFHYGRNSLQASPGDIVYIARGLRHRRESSLESPLALCNIALPEAMLHAKDKIRKPRPLMQLWRGAGIPETASNAFEILKSLMPAKAGRGRRLDKRTGSLVCSGLSKALDFQASLLGRKAPWLPELAGRIALNPCVKLKLEEEAERAGVSKFHLSRSFREAFGVGMIEYRDLARIDMAIEALISSDEKVESLGRRLGYSSKAHFINTFKRVAGGRPASIRKIQPH